MDWSSVFQFLGTDVPTQGLIWTILALGVFISYKILNVADLSVDTLFPFAGIISLALINTGVDPLVSLLISIVAGMAVGYLNAALHVYLKVDSLLAGIIIMVALYTPNVVISHGNTSLTDKLSLFGILSETGMNQIAVKILVLAFFAGACMMAMYWFFGTELGLSLRASGKNATMAKAQGVNTNRMYFLGMIISSALIALAGALYAQMKRNIQPDAGKGAVVVGLTIIFLGDVVFNPKSFKLSLISVVFGGLVYWLILDIIIDIPGFQTNYLNLMKAILITGVVGLYALKKLWQKKKTKKQAMLLAASDAARIAGQNGSEDSL